MGLFDDKEDVLDVQLTQYGKRMLNLGKLMPKFYSFGDEDIIYDASYANVDEGQEYIQTRILDETARNTPQHTLHGIETEFKNDVNALQNDEVYLNEEQPEADRTYSSISSLGNSQRSNKYRPAWKLKMLASEISSSYPTITGSVSDLRIPQIDLKDVIYDVNILRELPSELVDQLVSQNFETIVYDNEVVQFPGGSIVEVVNQDIFIDLQELNSMFKNDNFEIEVFITENRLMPGVPADQQRKTLIPLHFKQQTFQRDDIYDEEEFFNEFGEGEIDPSFVEYYLDIQTDVEIPTDIFCKYVEQDKRQGIYGNYRDCPDTTIVIRKEDYSSDADPTRLEEPCDD